jgi:hypothetical protein
MSWLNSFKKNESAMSKLSKKVFGMSFLCAGALIEDLEEKFGRVAYRPTAEKKKG